MFTFELHPSKKKKKKTIFQIASIVIIKTTVLISLERAFQTGLSVAPQNVGCK